jgi:hypothetical protein
MSSCLHKAKQFHKARAIIYVWPEIVNAVAFPAGARFQIASVGENHERFRFSEKN